jgi:hypothetical protein
MNKNILSLLGVAFTLSASAQEPADALRYSWTVPGGTARVKAIGGAMGSLGGDITASFVNPAGLAFYKTGDLIFSPNFLFGKTKGTYLGRTETDNYNRFTWGTTGFVVGGGDENKNVRNVAFSIAYNRMADFNSSVLYRGKNTQSSYSQKFLEQIGSVKDGNVVASEYPFGSSLAFNTFLIDTIGGSTNGNFQFQSRAIPLLAQGLLQQNSVETHGGIDELALGIGASVKDKWMFGGTIGIPFLHFKREASFIETDPTDDKNNKFDFFDYRENLSTTGVGFNVKGGVIFKPQEFWRLGLAVHSPTFYGLTDTYDANMTTNTDNYKGEQYQSSADITDQSEFKYTYISPYKVIGSISYVIREIQDVTRQRGFLTADVEYINYKASSFHVSDESSNDQSAKDYLKTLNEAINNAYKGAFNFKVGGELKFTTIMFRLGAAFFGNPYKDIAGEKGSKMDLSGGLGYRNKGFFIDLTYVHSINKDVQFAYRLRNAPYSPADIRNTQGNIYATVGWKF